jgi:hypothetical protein
MVQTTEYTEYTELSTNDAFILQLGIMAEVDKQAEFKAGGFEVVVELSAKFDLHALLINRLQKTATHLFVHLETGTQNRVAFLLEE